jgi:hypothetical protein
LFLITLIDFADFIFNPYSAFLLIYMYPLLTFEFLNWTRCWHYNLLFNYCHHTVHNTSNYTRCATTVPSRVNSFSQQQPRSHQSSVLHQAIMFIQYTSSPPHYFPSSQTWIINWPPSIRHLVTTTSHAHYINVGFTNSSVCATNPTLLHESDLQEGRSSSTNVKQTNHCRNPASIHRNGTQFNFMTSFHLPISKLCDVHFARFSWYHHHPNATPIRPQQIECHVSMADQLDTNPHLSSTCSESTIFLLHLSNLGSRFFPTGGGCDGWNTKMIAYTFNYNPTKAFPYYYSHMQLDS